MKTWQDFIDEEIEDLEQRFYSCTVCGNLFKKSNIKNGRCPKCHKKHIDKKIKEIEKL